MEYLWNGFNNTMEYFNNKNIILFFQIGPINFNQNTGVWIQYGKY